MLFLGKLVANNDCPVVDSDVQSLPIRLVVGSHSPDGTIHLMVGAPSSEGTCHMFEKCKLVGWLMTELKNMYIDDGLSLASVMPSHLICPHVLVRAICDF